MGEEEKVEVKYIFTRKSNIYFIPFPLKYYLCIQINMLDLCYCLTNESKTNGYTFSNKTV